MENKIENNSSRKSKSVVVIACGWGLIRRNLCTRRMRTVGKERLKFKKEDEESKCRGIKNPMKESISGRAE